MSVHCPCRLAVGVAREIRVRFPIPPCSRGACSESREEKENEKEAFYMDMYRTRDEPRHKPRFGAGRLVGVFWGPRPPRALGFEVSVVRLIL